MNLADILPTSADTALTQPPCRECGRIMTARSPGELAKRRYCSLRCTGDRLRRLPRRAQIIPERFWAKVEIGSPSECWEWQGSRRKSHYGQFMTPMRIPVGAHRVAYLLTNGPVLHGNWILHHCDNPPCCNPRHLYAGTPADNSLDAARRHRGRYRLSVQKAAQIRALRGATSDELAARFGVSRTTINRIRSGRTWREEAA